MTALKSLVEWYSHMRIGSKPSKRGPIPTVPFWMTLDDACRGINRLRFFDTRVRPLNDRHGAVYVWNSGRWAVAITKPEFLLRMFRNGSIVAKGGFHKKVPGSPFGTLFGESIVDSHGPTYVRFSTIIKPAIKKPTDIRWMREKSPQIVGLLLNAQSLAPSERGVLVDRLIQRWAGAKGPTNPLENALAAMKDNFPTMVYAEFPILEKFPPFLRSCRHAFSAIKNFEDLLVAHIDEWARARKRGDQGGNEKLVHRLVQARESSELSEFHYRSNLKMLITAGHENAYAALLPTSLYTGIRIRKGTWMDWNAYGVQTNPEFWGESAKEFQPSRWGDEIDAINNLFHSSQSKGYFITFIAYSRQCPGSGFALVQLKVALVEILREASWTNDPTYYFSTTSVAGLSPRGCRLVFTST
ncbi:cytochrome P450 [Aspergillus recurvatus]